MGEKGSEKVASAVRSARSSPVFPWSDPTLPSSKAIFLLCQSSEAVHVLSTFYREISNPKIWDLVFPKLQCQTMHATVFLTSKALYRANTTWCQHYTPYTCDVYIDPKLGRSYCHKQHFQKRCRIRALRLSSCREDLQDEGFPSSRTCRLATTVTCERL